MGLNKTTIRLVNVPDNGRVSWIVLKHFVSQDWTLHSKAVDCGSRKQKRQVCMLPKVWRLHFICHSTFTSCLLPSAIHVTAETLLPSYIHTHKSNQTFWWLIQTALGSAWTGPVIGRYVNYLRNGICALNEIGPHCATAKALYQN